MVPEVRQAAAELAQAWRASGRSQLELARRLGVSNQSLTAWRRAHTAVRAVEVVDDQPEPSLPRGLLVELPGGVRAAGLTIADLAELSRRLR